MLTIYDIIDRAVSHREVEPRFDVVETAFQRLLHWQFILEA